LGGAQLWAELKAAAGAPDGAAPRLEDVRGTHVVLVGPVPLDKPPSVSCRVYVEAGLADGVPRERAAALRSREQHGSEQWSEQACDSRNHFGNEQTAGRVADDLW